MQDGPVRFAANKHKLYTLALALALITVFYNMAEGLLSVFFGLEDESMSLFGFGSIPSWRSSPVSASGT